MWARLFLETPTWSHLSCTRDYGTLSVVSLSWNGLLEISDKLVPCRESRRSCSIDSFPASQSGSLKRRNFLLSSQGSRIVNMEKSSIVYSSLVRALNLQILKIKRGSTPRIDWNFMLRSSVLLPQTQSVVHRVFLVSLPSTVDYLDRWAHRHQCHDHTSPWRRSAIDFRNRIHDAEIAWADLVERRVAYTRYPTGSTDHYSPARL
jgi:hypothetical protein